MAQDNVEIARHALEAGMRMPPDLETVNALFAPTHVLVDRMYDEVEGEREWVGVQGFREHTAMRKAAWVGFAATIYEARAVDDERVLIVASLGGRGQRTGAPFEAKRGLLVTLRDGRVVRTEVHLSPEAAIEAAGATE